MCKPYAKDKEALRAKLLATTLSLDKLLRLEQLEWAVGLEAALGGGAAAGMAAATAGAGYGAGSYTRPLFGST